MKKDLIALGLVGALSVSVFVPVLIRAQDTDIVYVSDKSEISLKSQEEVDFNKDEEQKDKAGEVLGAEIGPGNAEIDSSDSTDLDVSREPVLVSPIPVLQEDEDTSNTHGSRGTNHDPITTLDPANVGSVEPIDEPYTRIKVTSPDGGESIKNGETVHITWTGGNPGSTVLVSLFHQNPYDITTNHGNPQLTEIASVHNGRAGGSMDWTVSDDVKPGRYFILVEEPRFYDSGTQVPAQISWDYSDLPFTVSQEGVAYFPVDINNDGKVNQDDVQLLVETQGACPTRHSSDIVPHDYCWTDMDNSKTVDLNDVGMILDHWNP